ncbi:hypothetical protein CLV58_109144 [Spirosoma oryzae]|uniref:Thoeris anti-defense 2-like domain-containing protein n=1 Tax=Spirosoma oryzae TaxID=1469603 RepID=A0A2T0SYD5_9BACT|nr:hypothetical protein [Spirosoma oryzae]PRY38417.1 hypothetical protein CLV58_109144 [Spirosoma oryzae]
MNFSEALQKLVTGHKMRRYYWKPSDYIYFCPGVFLDPYRDDDEPIAGVPVKYFEVGFIGRTSLEPQFFNQDNQLVKLSAASVLAEDWYEFTQTPVE